MKKITKRIISMFLLAFMVLGLVACGGGESSDADSSKSEGSEADKSGVSESGSADESKTEESKNDESKTDESKADQSEEASEETSEDDNGIIDDAGYEQFQKVSAFDKVLANRGWKDKGANSDYVPLNYDVMKAMWISQFDFGSIYCNGSGQYPEAQFRTWVEKAFDNLVDAGFNTVIVQTRPNADSFYPSAYYPWSYYVVGSYGSKGTYDPLEIMIEEAHERKLSFQAWINPMRGMSPTNLSVINKTYPMAQWDRDKEKDDYLYEYKNLVYLNIAYEEVRNLIINAAAEIVRHYDVDGIHMDDYFYFGEERAFDQKAYDAAAKKNAALNLTKFRYRNLNSLISGLYSAIKEENKNVIFGISPAGNLDKMATTYYADVKTWLSRDGYIDYIMPQIYFGMEHETWSYSHTYERWTAILKNKKIKFMPGITFLKVGEPDQYAGSGINEWVENNDVMKKCFEYTMKQEIFDGFAFFSYIDLWGAQSGIFNSKVQEEWDNCKKYFTEEGIPSKPIDYSAQ